jgi:hypothetical protein
VSAAEPLAGRTAQDGAPLSAVAAEVAAERASQGLPPTIQDPRALHRIAQLVTDPCPSGRVPGGEPPSRETDRAQEGVA